MEKDRQKAIEELQKQIKLGRERLGPEGIKELEKLAKNMQAPVAKAPTVPKGSVAYDKKAALKAFELFIKNHGDPREFERRLLEMLNKNKH